MYPFQCMVNHPEVGCAFDPMVKKIQFLHVIIKSFRVAILHPTCVRIKEHHPPDTATLNKHQNQTPITCHPLPHLFKVKTTTHPVPLFTVIPLILDAVHCDSNSIATLPIELKCNESIVLTPYVSERCLLLCRVPNSIAPHCNRFLTIP